MRFSILKLTCLLSPPPKKIVCLKASVPFFLVEGGGGSFKKNWKILHTKTGCHKSPCPRYMVPWCMIENKKLWNLYFFVKKEEREKKTVYHITFQVTCKPWDKLLYFFLGGVIKIIFLLTMTLIKKSKGQLEKLWYLSHLNEIILMLHQVNSYYHDLIMLL